MEAVRLQRGGRMYVLDMVFLLHDYDVWNVGWGSGADEVTFALVLVLVLALALVLVLGPLGRALGLINVFRG